MYNALLEIASAKTFFEGEKKLTAKLQTYLVA